MCAMWNILRKVGLKKFDDVKDSFSRITDERIDLDLPLGLRFNCLVEIPEVDFILSGDELEIKHPGAANSVISYGNFPVGDSLVHRFYLNHPDHVYMLQVITDSRKIVEEAKLFMSYDEVFPQDGESWDFWLSDQDGYIGLNVFDSKVGKRYYRVWENPDAMKVLEQDASGNQINRIPPLSFLENLRMDPYGKNSETIKYDSMLYGRHVSDNVDEYLMLSATQESDGASIQIMVGIPMEPASIKVI